MKKQKEKLTDASSIGRKLGVNIVAYSILFGVLTIIITYALSLTILPSLLTGNAINSIDYSGFVTSYLNTLLLSILSIALGLLGVFLAYRISFKSIEKKTTIYKTNVNTVKTTTLIIVGIFFLVLVVNGLSSAFENYNDYSNRKASIKGVISIFSRTDPDEFTAFDLYYLGYDSIEEFKENLEPTIQNLEKTAFIIQLLIILIFVDAISFIVVCALLLISIPRRINKLAIEEPSFEADLYGNIVSNDFNSQINNQINYEQNSYNNSSYDPNLYN